MVRSRLTTGSSPAFNFALTMGVVNLFGDMTYKGGGAINGQFMATLGASAAIVASPRVSANILATACVPSPAISPTSFEVKEA